jgi:hypothetical protein
VDNERHAIETATCDLISDKAYKVTQWSSLEEIEEIVTKFYHWWNNQPGSNTTDGFAEWLKLQARCIECGARTPEEAESECICSGDKDHCHGCELWPDV